VHLDVQSPIVIVLRCTARLRLLPASTTLLEYSTGRSSPAVPTARRLVAPLRAATAPDMQTATSWPTAVCLAVLELIRPSGVLGCRPKSLRRFRSKLPQVSYVTCVAQNVACTELSTHCIKTCQW